MVPGLAMFYGGLVRTKNVLGTLMHFYAAMAVVGVLWTVVGSTLSFGPYAQGGLIGWNPKLFLLRGIDPTILPAGVGQVGGAIALGAIAASACSRMFLLKNRLSAFGIEGTGGIVGAIGLTFFIREPWWADAAAKTLGWECFRSCGSRPWRRVSPSSFPG